ncbi:MAG: hypothetical protein K6T83_04435 [Alicyclobacillus sp.]|nr:hypothetical protein [Alicyclobacillus sp.]
MTLSLIGQDVMICGALLLAARLNDEILRRRLFEKGVVEKRIRRVINRYRCLALVWILALVAGGVLHQMGKLENVAAVAFVVIIGGTCLLGMIALRRIGP